MGLMNLFKGAGSQSTDFKARYDLGMPKQKFVELGIKQLYSRILAECLARTVWKSTDEKIKYEARLYDSSLDTQARNGLITLIVSAIYSKSKRYVVYNADVVRVATDDEKKELDAALAAGKTLPNKVIINFNGYDVVDLLDTYESLLYEGIQTDNTQLNVSKSVVFKAAGLTTNTSLDSASRAIAQGKDVAKGLQDGTGVMIDAGSSIETPTPSTASTEQSYQKYNGLIAQALGLPQSWINGLISSGLSSTGEGDSRAIEQGIYSYFVSIYKPIIDTLFGTTISFRREAWRGLSDISSIMDMLDTTDLIDMPRKKKIVDSILATLEL